MISMPDAHAYHFVTNWRVEGTCGEVADILRDPLELPRWWPAVYLTVDELTAGDDQGVGHHVRLVTKGWLPYTLRWEFVVVDVRYPHGFTLEASGDFNGRGEWTFVQDGSHVDVTYEWRIEGEKRWLFEANHRWAMRQGLTSLELELLRRRTPGAAGRPDVPPPPGPVTYAGAALVAAGVAVAAGIVYLALRRRRTTRRRQSSTARR
jgi:hypothetical protein